MFLPCTYMVACLCIPCHARVPPLPCHTRLPPHHVCPCHMPFCARYLRAPLLPLLQHVWICLITLFARLPLVICGLRLPTCFVSHTHAAPCLPTHTFDLHLPAVASYLCVCLPLTGFPYVYLAPFGSCPTCLPCLRIGSRLGPPPALPPLPDPLPALPAPV